MRVAGGSHLVSGRRYDAGGAPPRVRVPEPLHLRVEGRERCAADDRPRPRPPRTSAHLLPIANAVDAVGRRPAPAPTLTRRANGPSHRPAPRPAHLPPERGHLPLRARRPPPARARLQFVVHRRRWDRSLCAGSATDRSVAGRRARRTSTTTVRSGGSSNASASRSPTLSELPLNPRNEGGLEKSARAGRVTLRFTSIERRAASGRIRSRTSSRTRITTRRRARTDDVGCTPLMTAGFPRSSSPTPISIAAIARAAARSSTA